MKILWSELCAKCGKGRLIWIEGELADGVIQVCQKCGCDDSMIENRINLSGMLVLLGKEEEL